MIHFVLLKKGLIFLDKRKKRDIEDLMKNYSNHIRPEGKLILDRERNVKRNGRSDMMSSVGPEGAE